METHTSREHLERGEGHRNIRLQRTPRERGVTETHASKKPPEKKSHGNTRLQRMPRGVVTETHAAKARPEKEIRETHASRERLERGFTELHASRECLEKEGHENTRP